jgi:hypothetical protein
LVKKEILHQIMICHFNFFIWYNARGLGGNNVLEDARLLSALIASSSQSIDWPKLMEKYERKMFARARIAVQESESAAEYFRSLRSRS